MLVAGVDEAGRGPVVGPMVVAAVMVREEDESLLAEAGVRDSKQVPPAERRELAELVREVAVDWRLEAVPARRIDAAVSVGELNSLEAEVVARLLASLRPSPELAVVDAPESKPGRFSRLLSLKLRIPAKLIAVAGADRRYPVVAAASILAKEERERLVAELRERLGDFGSGYPHDPKTLEFLRENLSAGRLPPEVRRSWLTVSRLRRELGMDSLEGYL